MIKHTAYLITAILLSAVVMQAQETGPISFIALEYELTKETPRWSGDKARLSKIFDDERRRLGTQFEKELLKWLAQDTEKHYWISFFIESESYLHGNKRLPELSLLIKEQGLTLVKPHFKDDDSKRFLIGLNFTAAILSDELGLDALALSHKHQVEELLRRDPSLSRHIPAVTQAQRLRYDEIRTGIDLRRTTMVVGDSDPLLRAPISGGIINGKARKLVKPVYPPAARAAGAQGTVTVRIVFDENGKVLSAKAIDGHPDLRQASEDAAMRSEFTPVKLSGQPVKVTGVIIYNFVAR